jgi:hypothetical protein
VPNPRMQPTGRTGPSSARVLLAGGDQRHVDLCGRNHESPQLMRQSLGRPQRFTLRTLIPVTLGCALLTGGHFVAVQQDDSLPPIGARVRVLAPTQGPGWHIGMLNQLRVPAPCYRVLLFAREGALRVVATLVPAELKRVQVSLDAEGRVRPEHPPSRGAPVSGEQWREVSLPMLLAGERRCQAHLAPPPEHRDSARGCLTRACSRRAGPSRTPFGR